jgi:nucleotide-binding universal stress UspA family protein
MQFKDRHCKTKVVTGDPSDQISKYIRSEKMDLVIVGTHGRKGIDEIMLGNVAHRVIKNSPVPVLTVNPYLALK